MPWRSTSHNRSRERHHTEVSERGVRMPRRSSSHDRSRGTRNARTTERALDDHRSRSLVPKHERPPTVDHRTRCSAAVTVGLARSKPRKTSCADHQTVPRITLPQLAAKSRSRSTLRTRLAISRSHLPDRSRSDTSAGSRPAPWGATSTRHRSDRNPSTAAQSLFFHHEAVER
jgi:hypothetical protein